MKKQEKQHHGLPLAFAPLAFCVHESEVDCRRTGSVLLGVLKQSPRQAHMQGLLGNLILGNLRKGRRKGS